MKTPEELNALKEEVEIVSKKLHALTEEELAQVSGGTYADGLADQYTGISYYKPSDEYITRSH